MRADFLGNALSYRPFADVLHVSVNELLAHVSFSKLPAQ